MEDEKFETENSTNPEEGETSETPKEETPEEETPTGEQETPKEPEKTDSETKEANKKLYARMKKAETRTKELEAEKSKTPVGDQSDSLGLAKNCCCFKRLFRRRVRRYCLNRKGKRTFF